MTTTETVLVAAAVTVGVVTVYSFTLPKYARPFAKGPKGETMPMWDPTSIPAAK